jgi:hypothetical protein
MFLAALNTDIWLSVVVQYKYAASAGAGGRRSHNTRMSSSNASGIIILINKPNFFFNLCPNGFTEQHIPIATSVT